MWSDTDVKPEVLSSLREIDLYSFQGLTKTEAESEYKDIYELWKKHPASFEVDGHYPVRELWFRASFAWQNILRSDATNILVVAHNAINQAMIHTAIGLPRQPFVNLICNQAA